MCAAYCYLQAQLIVYRARLRFFAISLKSRLLLGGVYSSTHSLNEEPQKKQVRRTPTEACLVRLYRMFLDDRPIAHTVRNAIVSKNNYQVVCEFAGRPVISDCPLSSWVKPEVHERFLDPDFGRRFLTPIIAIS